jgi:cell division protein FtsB
MASGNHLSFSIKFQKSKSSTHVRCCIIAVERAPLFPIALYKFRAILHLINTGARPMLTTNGALLNASSELDQLREENERLKDENEQLKQQIEKLKESIRKPNDRIDTLEEIIEERDDDIDTLKKEIDLSAASLVPAALLTRYKCFSDSIATNHYRSFTDIMARH